MITDGVYHRDVMTGALDWAVNMEHIKSFALKFVE